MSNELEHYGVLGMRWGRRKSSEVAVSPEHQVASEYKRRAQKDGLSSLTNNELRTLNERLNLETNYAKMTANSATTKRGLDKVQTALKYAAAAQSVYAAWNSPLGKAGRKVLSELIKSKTGA